MTLKICRGCKTRLIKEDEDFYNCVDHFKEKLINKQPSTFELDFQSSSFFISPQTLENYLRNKYSAATIVSLDAGFCTNAVHLKYIIHIVKG